MFQKAVHTLTLDTGTKWCAASEINKIADLDGREQACLVKWMKDNPRASKLIPLSSEQSDAQ